MRGLRDEEAGEDAARWGVGDGRGGEELGADVGEQLLLGAVHLVGVEAQALESGRRRRVQVGERRPAGHGGRWRGFGDFGVRERVASEMGDWSVSVCDCDCV